MCSTDKSSGLQAFVPTASFYTERPTSTGVIIGTGQAECWSVTHCSLPASRCCCANPGV